MLLKLICSLISVTAIYLGLFVFMLFPMWSRHLDLTPPVPTRNSSIWSHNQLGCKNKFINLFNLITTFKNKINSKNKQVSQKTELRRNKLAKNLDFLQLWKSCHGRPLVSKTKKWNMGLNSNMVAQYIQSQF